MNIEILNRKLDELARQTRKAIDTADYSLAKERIYKVLELVPNHAVALADLAFVEGQLGNEESAFEFAEQALRHSCARVDPYVYDTLVAMAEKLHRNEEALYYARLAVKTKKQDVENEFAYPLPCNPPPGLSTEPKKNIISYSLFGNQPRYCEGAVLNAQLAKHIYPQWICRFYVDHSVPDFVIKRLHEHDAEVVYVKETQQKVSGLFWRFFVMSDPNVQCFIIRDADSLLSYKEKAAVDEWLASGKYFHVMRDAYAHSELILAGMWGGYNGVFPDMQQMVAAYCQTIKMHNKTVDQYFLRYSVWPTAAQSVCVHDSKRLEEGSMFFPEYPLSDIEKMPYFHIGMVDAHLLKTSLHIEQQNAKKVRWFLFDHQNNPVCHYVADVPKSGRITLYLPYFYSKRIQKGEWQIRTQVIE